MQEVFEKIIKNIGYRATNYKNTIGVMPGAEDRVEAYENAIKIVSDVAVEYNNGWIPCSEYLPAGKEWEFTDADGDVYHKHVLCQTDDSDVPMVVGFYQEGVWFTADTYDTIRVVAWQPLPQPYEPKED